MWLARIPGMLAWVTSQCERRLEPTQDREPPAYLIHSAIYSEQREARWQQAHTISKPDKQTANKMGMVACPCNPNVQEGKVGP